MAFFYLKSYLYRTFLFKFKVSTLKSKDVQNFSQIVQKIKDLEFQTRTDSENVLMTSYKRVVVTSSKFFMVSRDFGGDWTTNKEETWGGGHSKPIFYQNNPSWIELSFEDWDERKLKEIHVSNQAIYR